MRVMAWRRRSVLDRVRRSALGGGIAAGALAGPLLLAPQAFPQSPAKPATPPVNVGYPVSGVQKVAAHPSKGRDETTAKYVPSAVHWPSAHTATAALAAGAADGTKASGRVSGGAAVSAGAKAYAAGTPVWGQALAPAHDTYQGPGGVSVSVADHATALRAGVNGVLFTAAPSGSGRGQVRVGLDYGGFAQAYGGNYGSRLRLVQLPACALTTPQLAACRTQTPLASTNDVSAQSRCPRTVTLGQRRERQRPVGDPQREHSGADGQRARSCWRRPVRPRRVTAADRAGTYAATSLKASGSWSAGGSTGSFDYSYPITCSAGGLIPGADGLAVLRLGQRGRADRRRRQAQANWLGDGWSTPENYIEQTFVSCADSPEGIAAPQATGDLCYDGPILTLSLSGSSTSLVWDSSASSAWKPVSDNGEVVTHHTSTNNGTGTYNTDYWTVTDRSGTVYSFGLNQLPGWSSGKATTNSVQSEPVYSAHDPSTPNKTYSDPCYNATWSSSWCTMAYRWNLDYVKDLHGNAMAYYYKQDSNAYAQNANTTSATSYVRDAHLDHIDYGFTDGGAYGTIPDKVVVHHRRPLRVRDLRPAEHDQRRELAGRALRPELRGRRGLPGDRPVLLVHRAPDRRSPPSSGTARPTPRWTATPSPTPCPPRGDGTAATLWLSSITRTGNDTSAGGSAVPVPAVTFGGVQEANRVDTTTDGLPQLSATGSGRSPPRPAA